MLLTSSFSSKDSFFVHLDSTNGEKKRAARHQWVITKLFAELTLCMFILSKFDCEASERQQTNTTRGETALLRELHTFPPNTTSSSDAWVSQRILNLMTSLHCTAMSMSYEALITADVTVKRKSKCTQSASINTWHFIITFCYCYFSVSFHVWRWLNYPNLFAGQHDCQKNGINCGIRFLENSKLKRISLFHRIVCWFRFRRYLILVFIWFHSSCDFVCERQTYKHKTQLHYGHISRTP